MVFHHLLTTGEIKLTQLFPDGGTERLPNDLEFCPFHDRIFRTTLKFPGFRVQIH